MIKKKQKGFTLVELISVLCILAVIMVIVIPKGDKQVENAKKMEIKAEAKAYIDVATTLKSEGYFKNTKLDNIKLSQIHAVLDTDAKLNQYFESKPERITSKYHYLWISYYRKLANADLSVIRLSSDGETLDSVTGWDNLPG